MNQPDSYSQSWFLQTEQCKDSCVYSAYLVYVCPEFRQDSGQRWDRTIVWHSEILWNSQQHTKQQLIISFLCQSALSLCACNIVGHPSELILTLGSRDHYISLQLWISVGSKNQPSSKVLLWISLDMGRHRYRPAQVDAGRPARISAKQLLWNELKPFAHILQAHPSTKLIRIWY